jgi:uncharacterized membrane protein (DUF106 family)
MIQQILLQRTIQLKELQQVKEENPETKRDRDRRMVIRLVQIRIKIMTPQLKGLLLLELLIMIHVFKWPGEKIIIVYNLTRQNHTVLWRNTKPMRISAAQYLAKTQKNYHQQKPLKPKTNNPLKMVIRPAHHQQKKPKTMRPVYH